MAYLGLRSEGAAATAGLLRVRVVEHEALREERRVVIERRPVEKQIALLVDEDLRAMSLEDLIAKGFYSREEARQNVRRNILTRALGSGDSVLVDVLNEETVVGDIYLLCSDGLTEMVTDEQIRLTMQKFSASLNQAADALVALANENGGKDNVSVVLVRVDQVFAGKSLYQTLKAWI